MELIGPEIAAAGPPGWVSRLVEALQPLSVRADRLGAIAVFAGLQRPELELAARCFTETLVERGTRMTVQGHPSSRLWLITQGEALVSADARPIRVAGHGDVVGGATLLTRLDSPETTIALTSIRAFEAGPQQFRELIRDRAIRRRLATLSRLKHPPRRRTPAGASAAR
jgi:CRP-like cAMP-binding protein